ncbi:hypothetical protein VPH35_066049 [Triticum aestivum]
MYAVQQPFCHRVTFLFPVVRTTRFLDVLAGQHPGEDDVVCHVKKVTDVSEREIVAFLLFSEVWSRECVMYNCPCLRSG